MNTRTALKQASTHGGPVILGAGLAMFVVSLALPGPARHTTAEHQPPAVTIPPRTPAPVAGHRPRPSRPTPSPSSARAAERVLAAAPRTPDRPRPSAGGPSGPSPTPTSPPAAQGCHGSVVAVQVLRAACVSVGGSR